MASALLGCCDGLVPAGTGPWIFVSKAGDGDNLPSTFPVLPHHWKVRLCRPCALMYPIAELVDDALTSPSYRRELRQL